MSAYQPGDKVQMLLDDICLAEVRWRRDGIDRRAEAEAAFWSALGEEIRERLGGITPKEWRSVVQWQESFEPTMWANAAATAVAQRVLGSEGT